MITLINPSRLVRICFALAMAITTMPPVFADPGTISVSGSAEVRVAPDQLLLGFTIEVRNETLKDAKAECDKRTHQARKVLSDATIPASQISQNLISIRPVYNTDHYGAAQMSGLQPVQLQPTHYVAVRRIQVLVTDLASFETLLQDLLEAGVNQVDSAQLRSSEMRAHRDEARRMAVKAAKEKADAMAGVLGATVSGVKEINEQSGGNVRSGMSNRLFQNARVEGAGNGQLVMGRLQVTAAVHVVFQLDE